MGPTIGLNARNFTKKHYSEQVIKQYNESVLSWCKWVKAGVNCRVIFFPFCEAEHQNDLSMYEWLLSELKTNSLYIELYRYNTFSDLSSKIAQCELFLGVRFHSVLLAIQQHVPMLAFSYGESAYSLMTELGLRDYVLRVKDVTFDLLKEKWEMLRCNKESLAEMLEIITQEQKGVAMGYFDLISRALDPKS